MAEANKSEPKTPTEVIQNHDRVVAERSAKSMAVAEKSTGYVVAPGKSLATPRGIVSEGQVIGLADFEDEKFFKQRQDEGYIVAESKSK
jgi:hypothetical protein